MTLTWTEPAAAATRAPPSLQARGRPGGPVAASPSVGGTATMQANWQGVTWGNATAEQP